MARGKHKLYSLRVAGNNAVGRKVLIGVGWGGLEVRMGLGGWWEGGGSYVGFVNNKNNYYLGR